MADSLPSCFRVFDEKDDDHDDKDESRDLFFFSGFFVSEWLCLSRCYLG